MDSADFDKLVHLNLLLGTEQVGPTKALNLIKKFKDVRKIYSAGMNTLTGVDGISEQLAKRILTSPERMSDVRLKAEQDLEKLHELGGKIITYWDETYPPLLKKIYSPPLLLHVLGELTGKDDFCVAIVGTRMPTAYGRAQAERFSRELSLQGITIVSGLARGIDSAAHKAALKSGGRTVSVIGSGLDVVYPPENKDLLNQIKDRGAVISEFELGTKPDAPNFPKRNRIISGLSLGTLIIETKVNGGAMQTATHALDQNREVFSVPGNLGVKQCEGTNILIQKGEAKLVMNPEDVLVELELKLRPIVGKNIPKPDVDLNLFEEKILNALGTEPLQIDKLAEITSISTAECLVNLLSLEFKGLVQQLPGKNFIKTI